MDKCVDDIMKEKNISPEKDTRYAVFMVIFLFMRPHPANFRDHTQF